MLASNIALIHEIPLIHAAQALIIVSATRRANVDADEAMAIALRRDASDTLTMPELVFVVDTNVLVAGDRLLLDNPPEHSSVVSRATWLRQFERL